MLCWCWMEGELTTASMKEKIRESGMHLEKDRHQRCIWRHRLRCHFGNFVQSLPRMQSKGKRRKHFSDFSTNSSSLKTDILFWYVKQKPFFWFVMQCKPVKFQTYLNLAWKEHYHLFSGLEIETARLYKDDISQQLIKWIMKWSVRPTWKSVREDKVTEATLHWSPWLPDSVHNGVLDNPVWSFFLTERVPIPVPYMWYQNWRQEAVVGFSMGLKIRAVSLNFRPVASV